MHHTPVDAFGMDTDDGERVSDINSTNCLLGSSDLLQITEDQITTSSNSQKVDICAIRADAYNVVDCTVNDNKTEQKPMLQLPAIGSVNDERRKIRARSKKIHTGVDSASLSMETPPSSQPLRLKTASSVFEDLDVDVLTVSVCDKSRSKQRKSARRRSQNVFPYLLPHGGATSLLEETEPPSEGTGQCSRLKGTTYCKVLFRRGSCPLLECRNKIKCRLTFFNPQNKNKKPKRHVNLCQTAYPYDLCVLYILLS